MKKKSGREIPIRWMVRSHGKLMLSDNAAETLSTIDDMIPIAAFGTNRKPLNDIDYSGFIFSIKKIVSLKEK